MFGATCFTKEHLVLISWEWGDGGGGYLKQILQS